MIDRYWLDKEDVPFKTLLNVAAQFLSAEAYEAGPDCIEDLVEVAHTHANRERFITFKAELRQVALGHTDGLRDGALFTAADYAWDEFEVDDDVCFARALWHRLYPDEPLPAPTNDG